MEDFDKQKGWSFYTQAVAELVESPWRLNDDGSLDYLAGQTPIAESVLTAKAAELQAAEPMRLLREKRDRLLSESDWTGASDTALTTEQQSGWRLYRQKLRDLPSTASPTLDENGQLQGVTWPTKP